MISISRMLCDTISPGDYLRFRETAPHSPHSSPQPPTDPPRPVVVWNCTRQCNLRCVHCYASATEQKLPEEMDTEAGKKFISNLADFGAPVILFSGGEPLIRPDLLDLAEFAAKKGLRVALSTNGTLMTKEKAERMKDIGFAEVGISLDGIGDSNDRFRGKPGAFQSALNGIRTCAALGIRVSLRLTITRLNYEQIPAIFDLVEREGINRVCLYHLAYSGRGGSLQKEDLDHEQTRAVVDLICDRTVDMHKRGLSKEILTVSNHADGVYLYVKTKKQNPERAARMMELLKMNGGNNSGIRISSVDNMGNVHPDQFWWQYSLGNVRQRQFSDIWSDTSEPLLKGLRNRKKLLNGRCARCQFLDVCNGNLRVRAEAVSGDIWADDPACYLTDEEIGLAQ